MNSTDIIVTLTKYDLPNTEADYVALGHFDKVSFDPVENQDEFFSFRRNNRFRPQTSELNSETTGNFQTKDMEGMLRNYLIASEHNYGNREDKIFPFRFMVTISINALESEHGDKKLNHYANELATELKDNIEQRRKKLLSKQSRDVHAKIPEFAFGLFYPTSRGDIVIIIDADRFSETIKCLYEFVDGNEFVLSSYTIPMVRKSWITSTQVDDTIDNELTIRLRATVKEYRALYDFVINKLSCGLDSTPEFFAAFGAEDVIVDFGAFSEKKFHSIISTITKDNVQEEYRDRIILSAEMDMPYRVTVDACEYHDDTTICNDKAATDVRKQYGCLVSRIDDVYEINEDMSARLHSVGLKSLEIETWKTELYALKSIFYSQLSALQKIRETRFFVTISESFWNAFDQFLELAKSAKQIILEMLEGTAGEKNKDDEQGCIDKIKSIRVELSSDSYYFIKTLDNALQGYLNSDRQFLEFPGHRVSLYDLPIKLGVVYINYINTLIASLNPNAGKYLLCPAPPSPDGAIVTSMLHHHAGSENERMYIIQVPADLLFRPMDLCIIIAHEVMHNVNRENRIQITNDNLSNRNMFIIETVVSEIADIVSSRLSELFCISDSLKRDIGADILRDTRTIYKIRIPDRFNKPAHALHAVRTTLTEISLALNDFYFGQAQYIRAIEKSVCGRIKESNLSFAARFALTPDKVQIAFDEAIYGDVKSCISIICYLYKECAADVQAIKLLGISADKYISMIKDEYARLLGDKLHLKTRAQVICYFMEYTINCGEWSGALMRLADALAIGINASHSTAAPTVKHERWHLRMKGKSYTQLIDYLKLVYNGFQPTSKNEARSMYESIVKAYKTKTITNTLIEYML